MLKPLAGTILGLAFLIWAVPTDAPAQLKVGMVFDSARVEDAGFNQACRAGLQKAALSLPIATLFRESARREDYRPNLQELVTAGCGLIIGAGYQMHADLAVVAEQNPRVKFALIDSVFAPPKPNVQSITFDVDEAAFPAGFLAAAWADLQDPQDAQVGYVGGVRTAAVEQFVAAYRAGVAHYNKQYNKAVKVRGDYADTFEDSTRGQALGAAQIAAGIDVIFGVGGTTGAGALRAAQIHGKWGIGVDVDQYETLPEVRDILLTSCLKKMDQAIAAVVQEVLTDKFGGGRNRVGKLANDQVGLAPWHAFENRIPAWLQQDLETIQQAIRAGRLATGWPPSYVLPW